MSCLFSHEMLSTFAQPEPWNSDHEEGSPRHGQDRALAFRDIATVVDRGNWLFWAISVVDENWHTEVYEGKTPYKPEEDAEITGYYQIWLHTAEKVLNSLNEHESRGHQVPGAEVFRKNCREARGLLTDDASFFSDDALVDLRDRAIDDFRAGRTADFHVLGE
jgi:hypothetical protein